MLEVQSSRQTILTVAAKLFAKLGLDKCSTREIAKESNSNISSISYYFGGKEGLYKEVMREFALEIKARVQSQIDNYKDLPVTKSLFIKEMNATVESMIFFRTKYPEVAQIFSREKLTGLQHSKDIHEQIFYPLMQNFFELVKKAQAQKIVKPGINPALLFILLSEGIWGFYELAECPTPLLKDCQDVYDSKTKLSQQITLIFIEGVLL